MDWETFEGDQYPKKQRSTNSLRQPRLGPKKKEEAASLDGATAKEMLFVGKGVAHDQEVFGEERMHREAGLRKTSLGFDCVGNFGRLDLRLGPSYADNHCVLKAMLHVLHGGGRQGQHRPPVQGNGGGPQAGKRHEHSRTKPNLNPP